MKKFTEIYNKKTCLRALVCGLILGAVFAFFSPIAVKRTEPISWQFEGMTILICTVCSLGLTPLFKTFCFRKTNSKIAQFEQKYANSEKIYNKSACINSLIFGLPLGALFTFYPPFVRTEPLTWQLACGIFLIAIVGCFVFIPPIQFGMKKLRSKIDKGDDNEQPQN